MVSIAVAGLGLVSTGHAVWPVDSVAGGTGMFLLKPSVNGRQVAACNGFSPLSNVCGAAFASDDCKAPLWCSPQISGTLGYTGSITSYIHGLDLLNVPRSVWKSCSFIGGSSVGAGGVVSGGCSYGTNAPYMCPQGQECGHYLKGPFTLEGVATPPLGAGAAAGPWTVSVQN